jgi:hypothetical protein
MTQDRSSSNNVAVWRPVVSRNVQPVAIITSHVRRIGLRFSENSADRFQPCLLERWKSLPPRDFIRPHNAGSKGGRPPRIDAQVETKSRQLRSGPATSCVANSQGLTRAYLSFLSFQEMDKPIDDRGQKTLHTDTVSWFSSWTGTTTRQWKASVT